MKWARTESPRVSSSFYYKSLSKLLSLGASERRKWCSGSGSPDQFSSITLSTFDGCPLLKQSYIFNNRLRGTQHWGEGSARGIPERRPSWCEFQRFGSIRPSPSHCTISSLNWTNLDEEVHENEDPPTFRGKTRHSPSYLIYHMQFVSTFTFPVIPIAA